MSLKSFFKSRTFFIHLGLTIGGTVLLVWLAGFLLGLLTKHGDDITVPDLTGVKTEELEDYLSDRNLKFEIIDSVYNSKLKKGTVYSQDPYPNSKVKSGRKIYVTVIAKLLERTTVPELKDLTLRQTIAVLETYGLKIGKLSYVPDIAHNAVLKQMYKGSIIAAGTNIEKNSSIDLVLGQGENNEKASVPCLLGKTREHAIKLISEYSLNIDDEIFEEGADTSNARVYKQSPSYSRKSSVALGSSIKIWYKSSKKFDYKSYLKKCENDSTSSEE